MTFKPAKCPNCAGELQLPEDRDTVKCMYCGSDIVVREAIKLAGGVNIENLMKLAGHSEKTNNYDEAYKYYSTILENDVGNIDAWLGKGRSKPTDIDHMKICFEKAITLADNDDKREKVISFLENSIVNGHAYPYCDVLLQIDPHNIKALTIYGNYEEIIPLAKNKDDKDFVVDYITETLQRDFYYKGDPSQFRISESWKNPEWINKLLNYINEIGESDKSLSFKKQVVGDISRWWIAIQNVQYHSDDDKNAMNYISSIFHRFTNEIKAVDRNYQPLQLSQQLKRENKRGGKGEDKTDKKDNPNSFWKKLFE